MNRAQLAHVLRAAREITDDANMLVIGSQAILASYDENDLPWRATASAELDVAFFDDPDDAKADRVDGAIGELSQFHETFGYYAQGVSVQTAVLPAGWRDRLVYWSNESSGGANARFLDKHDLAISKLVALREKDRAFVSALLDAGLLDASILRFRVHDLPDEVDRRIVEAITDFLRGWT